MVDTKIHNVSFDESERFRWWRSYGGPHYKGHVNSWGRIRGTYRFIVSYICSRNIIWYPLWKIVQCFYAIKNALFCRHKSWRNKIIDEKKNRRIANGLASVLLDTKGRVKRRTEAMIKRATPVDELPQIGGVDPEEYDENCVIRLKAKE